MPNVQRMTLPIVAALALWMGMGMGFTHPAQAQATAATTPATSSFASWVQGMRQEALQKGIRQDIVDKALPLSLQPIQRVIELDRKQPEGTMTFARYRTNVINQARIDKGREMMRLHAAELADVEKRYGVQPQYVVALWGLETSYGSNTGGFDLINALATLAWDGRRASFFRSELLKALQILNEGHITHDRMKGSWAGAMGQNQFMPSSFHSFAVDGDGDGHKDIWTNKRDVFASTANYLARSGWKGDERWGQEVRLPASFPASQLGLDVKKSLSAWNEAGVTLPNGNPLPVVAGMTASIVRPDKNTGPAYVVYDNFRTVMKWNRSTYFATTVGLLADAIAQ